ncbi:MAG: hypothetical protein WCK67_01700 [bacterium]
MIMNSAVKAYNNKAVPSFTSNKNDDKNKKELNPTLKYVAAVPVAYVANAAVNKATSSFLNAFIFPNFNKYNNQSIGLADQEGIELANKFLKKANLENKVELVVADSSPQITSKIKDLIFKDSSDNIIIKLFKAFKSVELNQRIDKFVNVLSVDLTSQIVQGDNASFLPSLNKIVVAKKQSMYLFHEIGHSINANSGKFINSFIGASRMFPAFIPVILACTAFKSNKIEKTDKNNNPINKVVKFIGNNAPVLGALSFLPMLAEEGLASIHGLKFLKDKLPTSVFNKILKSNALAFSTYLVTGLGAIGGLKLAQVCKDTIDKPKQC